MWAAERGYTTVAQALLEAGANPHLLNKVCDTSTPCSLMLDVH
jgi:hypothetical protein